MNNLKVIGKSITRKDSLDKVSGTANYTNDFESPGLLHARLLTSPYAHAKIKLVDVAAAEKAPGVRVIITGEYFPHLTGPVIEDHAPIAFDKVRYYGEPVAIVIADSQREAAAAVSLIRVEYEPLPVINSLSEALKNKDVLVHEKLESYKLLEKAYPEANTNIANRTKIRKGDVKKAFSKVKVTAVGTFSFPQTDYASMETRCSIAQIQQDGQVVITSASQSPLAIKSLISTFFNIEIGKISVTDGSYGGKAAVQLELLAFLASKAVGGRTVKIINTREEDLITSPVNIGLEAKIKLGSMNDGRIMAAEISLFFDGGAYSDRAVIISRAAAVDCTGPYNIENVWCDSLCMYTNHPYATTLSGIGHSELTFAIERTMDLLAGKLKMDPIELRLRNAILPGDTSPTQTILNTRNIGNLPKCIERLCRLIDWEEGTSIELGKNKVRTKGISCFWKTSGTAFNAEGSAVLTFNLDGSIKLTCGAVELGKEVKTALSKILAEKMKMEVDRIQVVMDINTQTYLHCWKISASKTIMLVGRAVLSAAEDAIFQLKEAAAIVLKCFPEELTIEDQKVVRISDANSYIAIKDILLEEQVIGRGKYMISSLSEMDKYTGKGHLGTEWTLGAQGVEVEFDRVNYSYKLIKAVSVIDVGKVMNLEAAIGQVTGGMNMGLSFASRESLIFTNLGVIENGNLRTYKPMRYGENPEYIVEFIESPNLKGPYGTSGIGEYGIIGMAGALANSLSEAAQVPLNQLPLMPEYIWKTKKGGKT
ncbi:MAG: xanthine dehydrogenase family protein molybdopterin-binding subunit [Clostridiaceae bacterium]|nr:xanthine dehydrogenase family protein molybdopterin-binding subunit [Clostridiaceae bacterium]